MITKLKKRFNRISALLLIAAMVAVLVPVMTFAAPVETVGTWGDMGAALTNVDNLGSIEVIADLSANSMENFLAKTVKLTSDAQNRTITRDSSFPTGAFFNVPAGAIVTMEGGAGGLTLDGNSQSLLIINSGTLTLENIMLSNTQSGPAYSMGAIINSGSLEIGAGVQFENANGYVGAVNNSGNLTISGGTIVNSSTIFNDYGGGITLAGGLSSGTLEIEDADLASNPAYKMSAALNSSVIIYPSSTLSAGDIVFVPDAGYSITQADVGKVTVDGNYTLGLDSGNIIVTGILTNTYTFAQPELTYLRDHNNLENTIDSDAANIAAITLNGNDLLSAGYCSLQSIGPGSTRIVFDSAWLETLANGSYTISAMFLDGAPTATMRIIVADASSGDPTPPGGTGSTGSEAEESAGAGEGADTGDGSTTLLWIMLLMGLSGLGYAVFQKVKA